MNTARIRTATLLAVSLLSTSCRSTTYLPAEGALGPYSAGVLAGDFHFVSGQIGDTTGTFEVQVHTAIDRLQRELTRSGLTLSDVVSVTAFLTDIDDYAAFNTIYAARFSPPYPARACIAVKALPAGARVEIQAIARRSG